MRKTIEILKSTLKLATGEIAKNKLRTFLSLFGVTIGIFCIIGVLSTVKSLEKNIQDGVKSLGANTVYIDKWDYKGGADFPWWKYVNRPTPTQLETRRLKEKMGMKVNVVYSFSPAANISVGSTTLSNVAYHGVTEEFDQIIPVDVYISGCPPRPEALLDGLMKLQNKLMTEHSFLDQKRALLDSIR